MLTCRWREPFASAAVEALHAEGFGHEPLECDGRARLSRPSPGWACARDGSELVGFANVAWDGGTHAFILDTVVASRMRRQGVGTMLVALAVAEARAAGCEWLHVDVEEFLRPFYFGRCGFTPTNAGLIAL